MFWKKIITTLILPSPGAKDYYVDLFIPIIYLNEKLFE